MQASGDPPQLPKAPPPGSISIGGSVTGSAVAAGQHITQTVTFHGSDAEERQRALDAIVEINKALQLLSGTSAMSAKVLAGAAVEKAKEAQPNKDEIGNMLETALKAARGAAEFAGIATKLAPFVHTASVWLGGQWASLMALLV